MTFSALFAGILLRGSNQFQQYDPDETPGVANLTAVPGLNYGTAVMIHANRRIFYMNDKISA